MSYLSSDFGYYALTLIIGVIILAIIFRKRG